MTLMTITCTCNEI